jgi:hypothetical protein
LGAYNTAPPRAAGVFDGGVRGYDRDVDRVSLPAAATRILGAGACAAACLGVHTGPALAAAGGGAAEFGGGGAGSGGAAGGSYGGSSGQGPPLWFVIAFAAVVLVISAWSPARTSLRRYRRMKAVRVAAAEAELVDPWFAYDSVLEAAEALFRAIQTAWDAGDRAALRRLTTTDLWAEWERRLDELARRTVRNRVRVETLLIDYVGLANHGSPDEDRVVVRVVSRLADYLETADGRAVKHTGARSTVRLLTEFWTLAPRDDRWIVAAIEQGKAGSYHMTEPLLASPELDSERLRSEAVAERTAGEAPRPVRPPRRRS